MKEKTLTLSRETLRQLDSHGVKPRPAGECDTTSYTSETRNR